MGVSNNLFYTYTIHIKYIYIESLSIYFENNLLLQLSLRAPLAGLSSYERQILEGDNFENYGRKDQCIYV